MSSAIPLTVSGAVVSTSTKVENAHTPGDDFTVNCTYLALPSDCTARILPSQINAIVSELMALAECFNPDGTWDCNSVTNMCTAFTAYRTDTTLNLDNVSLFSDVQKLLCGTTEQPVGAGSFYLFCNGAGEIHKAPAGDIIDLCDQPAQAAAAMGDFYIVCTAAGDIVRIPATAADPGDCQATVDAICASIPCKTTLATCLVSAAPNNELVINPVDNLLYTRRLMPFAVSRDYRDSQNYPSGAATDLIFSTAETRGMTFAPNSNQVTVTEEGIYSLSLYANIIDGTRLEGLNLSVNGQVVASSAQETAAGPDTQLKRLSTGWVGHLNPGDVVSFGYRQVNDGATTFQLEAATFGIVKVTDFV